ncbi:MAG: hypothetical protein IKO49_07870 [Bacilli bacterium]|nr:hypothetical protein [Bacilli bacterium]
MYKIIFAFSSIFISLYFIFLIVFSLKASKTKKNLYTIHFNIYVISILITTFFLMIYFKNVILKVDYLYFTAIPAFVIFAIMISINLLLLYNFIKFIRKENFGINKVEQQKQISIMINDLENSEYMNNKQKEEIIEIL